MLVIGSKALSIVAPWLLNRTPKDIDLIMTCDEYISWESYEVEKISETKRICFVKGQIFEIELATESNSAGVLVDPDSRYPSPKVIADINLLFTIKKSHRFLKDSKFFWKTFHDYHALKNAGATVPMIYTWFLQLREKETYINKTPSLNQNKKQFFSDDNIEYIYDHDSIHEAVKIGNKAAYTYFKKEGEEVFSDKDKFFALPKEIQINAVLEECSVLALERSLVPYPYILTPFQAWKMAYSKVASSITSGWFREFAYENGPEILKQWPNDYYDKFQLALKKGFIKSYGK